MTLSEMEDLTGDKFSSSVSTALERGSQMDGSSFTHPTNEQCDLNFLYGHVAGQRFRIQRELWDNVAPAQEVEVEVIYQVFDLISAQLLLRSSK